MARIVYGVHGTGHGHAMRALAVARHFREHEFHFVSHGDGLALLRGEYPVCPAPNPETMVRGHAVGGAATFRRLLAFGRRRAQAMRSVGALFERFRPDLVLTDYEHLVPRVARAMGVASVSLDHQHVVPLCGDLIPWSRRLDYAVTVAAIRLLFSQADTFLVTSFFPVASARTKIFPPLLREAVLAVKPTEGEHVLAYQGYSTFGGFLPLLKGIAGPVVAYGLGRAGREGNVSFKGRDEDEFLADLASCRYVICGGGHSLISEALHLGKPVLSFPIRGAIEQWINARRLEQLGCGRHADSRRPAPDGIARFEADLPRFRERIAHGSFCGNREIFQALEEHLG